MPSHTAWTRERLERRISELEKAIVRAVDMLACGRVADARIEIEAAAGTSLGRPRWTKPW